MHPVCCMTGRCAGAQRGGLAYRNGGASGGGRGCADQMSVACLCCRCPQLGGGTGLGKLDWGVGSWDWGSETSETSDHTTTSDDAGARTLHRTHPSEGRTLPHPPGAFSTSDDHIGRIDKISSSQSRADSSQVQFHASILVSLYIGSSCWKVCR